MSGLSARWDKAAFRARAGCAVPDGEHIVVTWSPGVGLWRVKIDPNQLDQVLTNLVLNSRDAIEGNIGRIAIETANATLAGREARGLLPGPLRPSFRGWPPQPPASLPDSFPP